MMALLARVMGIGIETADMLVQEVLSRNLRDSQVADIEMTATPTGDTSTPTASSLTSLFQSDSVALLAEISFAYAPLRDNVVAVLEGVNWDGESTL
jgi:hypothetical protein